MNRAEDGHRADAEQERRGEKPAQEAVIAGVGLAGKANFEKDAQALQPVFDAQPFTDKRAEEQTTQHHQRIFRF